MSEDRLQEHSVQIAIVDCRVDALESGLELKMNMLEANLNNTLNAFRVDNEKHSNEMEKLRTDMEKLRTDMEKRDKTNTRWAIGFVFASIVVASIIVGGVVSVINQLS